MSETSELRQEEEWACMQGNIQPQSHKQLLTFSPLPVKMAVNTWNVRKPREESPKWLAQGDHIFQQK